MARNQTTVQEFDAEFTGTVPFSGVKQWVARRFQEMGTEPYAVSTIARDLRATGGWAELPVTDVFPRGHASYDMPVDRVFVRSRGAAGYGTIVALCDRRTRRS